MAMTVSGVTTSALPGGYVLVAGKATGSNVYLTGGETMDISAYVGGSPIVVMGGDDGYVAQHNRGTSAAGKVLLYEAGADAAALDEFANAGDASDVICTFMAIGASL